MSGEFGNEVKMHRIVCSAKPSRGRYNANELRSSQHFGIGKHRKVNYLLDKGTTNFGRAEGLNDGKGSITRTFQLGKAIVR